MSILGSRIKMLRKSKGLNQTELAEALNQQFGLNIDRAMISKWETDFQTPVINTIKCMATFFGVTMDYLNGNEPLESNITRYPQPNITQNYITFTPDPSPQAQTLLVFNKNGVAGGHEKTIPSDDVVNEINKLAKALMPYPAEQINALLKIVENGGNIPIAADMPPELKELISATANLSKESLIALIQVAKTMK